MVANTRSRSVWNSTGHISASRNSRLRRALWRSLTFSMLRPGWRKDLRPSRVVNAVDDLKLVGIECGTSFQGAHSRPHRVSAAAPRPDCPPFLESLRARAVSRRIESADVASNQACSFANAWERGAPAGASAALPSAKRVRMQTRS